MNLRTAYMSNENLHLRCNESQMTGLEKIPVQIFTEFQLYCPKNKTFIEIQNTV